MSKKPGKKKTVNVHVTHLEMEHPLKKWFPAPSKPRMAMMHAENIPVHFYRYLYDTIGTPHHWFLRKKMGDEQLVSLINGENCHIVVLYADGCVAGFYELNLEQLPNQVGLEYFGLISDFHGLGLGKWFLSEAIHAAWQYEPEKICVNTNTMDHASALPLYQKLGFSPVSVSDELIEIWE